MARRRDTQTTEEQPPATVVWEGDSLGVLRSFPVAIKRGLGQDIQRLQLGEQPLDSRPMKSVGPGVFELRQRDDSGWYRVIYLKRIANRLFMLHSFTKKSAKTSQNDLHVAKTRLKLVQERLREEKTHD